MRLLWTGFSCRRHSCWHLKMCIFRALPWLFFFLTSAAGGSHPHWKLLGVAVWERGGQHSEGARGNLIPHCPQSDCLVWQAPYMHTFRKQSADWKHLGKGGKMSRRPLEQVFLPILVLQWSHTIVSVQVFGPITVVRMENFLIRNKFIV